MEVSFCVCDHASFTSIANFLTEDIFVSWTGDDAILPVDRLGCKLSQYVQITMQTNLVFFEEQTDIMVTVFNKSKES